MTITGRLQTGIFTIKVKNFAFYPNVLLPLKSDPPNVDCIFSKHHGFEFQKNVAIYAEKRDL